MLLILCYDQSFEYHYFGINCGGRDHMHIDITQIGAGKVYLYNMMKLDYKV